jgi:SNF2 family DNA or RNA helicase
MADIELDIDPRHDTEIIRFTAPYMQNALIKEAGGAWNAKADFWQAPLTWATCIRARGVFGPELQVGRRLTEWSTREYERISNALAIRDVTGDADTMVGVFSSLYPHQYIGTDFLACAPEALLGDDMGTGKTATLLSALERMAGLPALVVCPTSVRENWTVEAATWLPEATPYEVKGTSTQRAKILAKAASDPTALVVINIEAVRSHSRLAPYGSISLSTCQECDKKGTPDLTPAKCERHPKELNTIPFRTFIIDEAHRLKDPKAKQTRAVWAVAHQDTVERRWAATGTPVANHPGDLWSILHCVSPAQFPAKTKFVDRYCQISPNPFGGIDITGLRPDNKEEFFKIFDPMFRRMTKARVLEFLPPKVRSVRYAPMTPKQAKAYNEMATEYQTELGSGWLTAAEGHEDSVLLVAAGRLVQFSSAHADVYEKTVRVQQADGSIADETRVAVKLQEPSNKLDVFMEILEDHGPNHPLVACAESRQLIEMASVRLEKEGIRHVLITGGQTAQERNQALADFQEGRVNLLLFTIKAGGTGLTMTRADTIIFLQRSWSMIDNKQAEDRVHRIGSEQHSSVHIIDIVAPGTIEEHQIEQIHRKQMLSDEVTRDAV